jgi:4-amino-4-deoxy-L-arabinose transferase-like glycosyltransferase
MVFSTRWRSSLRPICNKSKNTASCPHVTPETQIDPEARPLGAARAPRRAWRLPPVGCAIALALIHLLWLAAHLAPATMSPDANGYVVQARLIATEGRTWFSEASPAQFVGMHWLETQPGVFHSRYPAGLPLIMAAAWKIGGLNAALLVNPLLASATVLLVFFLARRFTGEIGALLAALVIAAVPVTNQHALDADAHVAATFFLVAGVLALRRFAAQPSPGWGLAAGALLGVVPTIRYPEAIVGLTIAAWLAWQVRPLWRVWPALLGAAIPLVPLLVHNAIAYGAFWRTGYALTNEQTGFGVGYFLEHALPYLQSLGGQGLGLFFTLGVAGLAALAADRRWRSDGLLFAGLVVPLVLLYMAYYFGGGPAGGGAAAGNLRFLIPTFPFFAVAGVWLLGQLVSHLGPAGRVAAVVVAMLQLIVGVGASMQTLKQSKTSLTAAARARAVAEKEIPAGSIVIVDRMLAESFDAAGHWKLVDENLVGAGGGGGFGGPGFRAPGGERGGAGEGRPSPQQAGKNRAQQERYAGLRPAERTARVWADVAAWAGGRPMFWFARSLDTVEGALPDGADYRSIAEVDAPVMGGLGGGPGLMGAGRGGVGARGGALGRGGMMFGPPDAGAPTGPMGFDGPMGMGGRRGGSVASQPTKLRVVRIDFAKSGGTAAVSSAARTEASPP